MEKLTNLVGILFFLGLAGVWIRNICIIIKRPQRKRELAHAISLILDPQGCSFARTKFDECDHLVEHYGLILSEAGYSGDMSQLEAEAEASYLRSLQRDRQAVAAFGYDTRVVNALPWHKVAGGRLPTSSG